MTQKDKDLLLKDLCARLPYGVKLYCNSNVMMCIGPYTLNTITLDRIFNKHTEYVPFDEVKPYLFPLSSMSEKQKEEFNTQSLKLQLQVIDEEIMYEKATEFEVDFYNKHHLDWRGLIPLGLAIDATNLNIY